MTPPGLNAEETRTRHGGRARGSKLGEGTLGMEGRETGTGWVRRLAAQGIGMRMSMGTGSQWVREKLRSDKEQGVGETLG